MIFKVAFLILLIYLFSTDKDCGELESLLYFNPSQEEQESQEAPEQTEDVLPDVNQASSPDEVARQIFDDI